MQNRQTTIIGGGIVGLSVAFGLLQAGRSVTVLDGADEDLRASQGNFGLVWLQGKGAHYPDYARWTSAAVSQWPEFARHLTELSGVGLHLDQPGGFEFFTDSAEFEAFSADLGSQKQTLGPDLPYEILTGEELRHRIPGIGQEVAGASFCARDGHVNPLLLLSALTSSVQQLGGQLVSGVTIEQITPSPGGGFCLTDHKGNAHGTEQLVLCAGLGSMHIAPQLGFCTRIRPQRGELLISEKLGSRLPFLSSTIRQVNEGGIQIGGTKAEAGLADSDTLEKTARLARHAVKVFPALKEVRVLRSWGALRIMTEDGFPVYAKSPEFPDACLVTCHSGVTLAPNHAGALANWIADNRDTPNLEAFGEHRFPISKVA